ncbi:CoB--CoM heterodisulfide reductase iron-sulfur subunit B family protein [Chloroflexota bacterium]
MKYGLFLGCNMPTIRPDVERAIRLTMPPLGVELVDLEGIACCPAFGTFPSADEMASLSVTAWNLSIAEQAGVDLIVECGSCYSSLKEGRDALVKHPDKMKKANELLRVAGKEFEGKAVPYHITDVLYNVVGVERIREAAGNILEGVKVVVQYPCHTLWPSSVVGFDDPGRPHILRELVEALGAEVQSFSREFQCCGGAGGFVHRSRPDAVEFVKKKFDSIKAETEAQLMVVSCITCLMHLDNMQGSLSKGDNKYSLPVLDYNQVLALCMGFDPKEVASISNVPRDGIIEYISAGRHQALTV